MMIVFNLGTRFRFMKGLTYEMENVGNRSLKIQPTYQRLRNLNHSGLY